MFFRNNPPRRPLRFHRFFEMSESADADGKTASKGANQIQAVRRFPMTFIKKMPALVTAAVLATSAFALTANAQSVGAGASGDTGVGVSVGGTSVGGSASTGTGINAGTSGASAGTSASASGSASASTPGSIDAIAQAVAPEGNTGATVSAQNQQAIEAQVQALNPDQLAQLKKECASMSAMGSAKMGDKAHADTALKAAICQAAG